MSIEEIQKENPLVFLLLMIIGGVTVFGTVLGKAFGGGASSRQRRALAKARRAKRLKARRRKK